MAETESTGLFHQQAYYFWCAE